MRPDNTTLIKRCESETQKLFEIFLDISEGKFQSKETNEVQYQVRETDSKVRSGSFGSSNSLAIGTRGLEDVSKYKDAIEKKRRSIECAPPLYGSWPGISTIESDSSRSPALKNFSPPPPPAMASHSRPKSSEIRRQRPSSAYEKFPSEGRSRSNTGPSDELLTETARTIAKIGDTIENDYRMDKVKSQLVSFLSENTTVSYEVFAAHVNDLVGEDRNWTNFLFVMQLGKRVLMTGQSLGSQTKEYFGRFMGTAFAEEIVGEAGNMNQYVRDHANTTTATGVTPNEQ